MSANYRDTTTVLTANTPVLIGAKTLGSSATIISNNGPGDMVWKIGAPPASALDGTPLGIPDTTSKQGGAVVLLGEDVAIGDPIYAWSVAGTTVNVKQGSPS